MVRNDLSEYKRKYDISRHHAWAGTVLISILLAIRIFLEISNILTITNTINTIIIIIGLILVVYTLSSLFLTYKYRGGISLSQEKKIIHLHSSIDKIGNDKIKSRKEKEQLKIEKKKAKTELKKAKKLKKTK